jgi:predicted cupin superfamily sugar epimerase
MTADEIKRILHLIPHPEGGSYIQTYKAAEHIPAEALRDRHDGPRAVSTAIYYLLEPGTFSEMHSLRSDEVFHFYLGDPVEMLQLWSDGTSRIVQLGPDLAAGQMPQVVVPKGVWQGSRLVDGGRYALLGCTVAPGFEFADYDSGDRETLIGGYPEHRNLITALTRKQSGGVD